ncbi:MAG: hypothetical protein QOH54_3846 [Mycobacterium sp.]|jgi:hypothetical protein|nr:hypothetical protein [Mycobacterium sp.]
MGVAEPNEQKIIDQLVARLATTHPSVPPERVAEVVHTIHSRFDERPLREFVPLFVERGAKRELSHLSASDA